MSLGVWERMESRNREVRNGMSVNDTMSEKISATEIVTPTCERKVSNPVESWVKMTGANTMTEVSVAASTAVATSREPTIDA